MCNLFHAPSKQIKDVFEGNTSENGVPVTCARCSHSFLLERGRARVKHACSQTSHKRTTPQHTFRCSVARPYDLSSLSRFLPSSLLSLFFTLRFVLSLFLVVLYPALEFFLLLHSWHKSAALFFFLIWGRGSRYWSCPVCSPVYMLAKYITNSLKG